MTTTRTAVRLKPPRRTCSRNSPWCHNISRIFRSKIRTHRSRSLARQEQPQIGIQINVGANPLSETDIEVVIKLEGKAETGAPYCSVSNWNLRACFASAMSRKRA